MPGSEYANAMHSWKYLLFWISKNVQAGMLSFLAHYVIHTMWNYMLGDLKLLNHHWYL